MGVKLADLHYTSRISGVLTGSCRWNSIERDSLTPKSESATVDIVVNGDLVVQSSLLSRSFSVGHHAQTITKLIRLNLNLYRKDGECVCKNCKVDFVRKFEI